MPRSLRRAASSVVLVLGCSSGSPAAPPPVPAERPAAPSAAAAAGVACHCFHWVHGPDHGHACFASIEACEEEKTKAARDSTACRAEPRDRCRKVACRDAGAECFEHR